MVAIRKHQQEMLLKAAAEPEFDHMGHVNMTRTFKKYGITKNPTYAQFFYKHLDPSYPTNKDTKGQAIASMPFGPKAVALGWKALKQPCLYAIVCKYTGRAYIGTSTSPWLRRAVHYYWLKNYWRYGSSNIFFGNLKLAEDVKEHGVDSFYLEVIQHMPNATKAELRKAETEFIKLHGLERCYNKWFEGMDNKSVNAFFDICPDFKALYLKCRDAYQEYDKGKVIHHEYMLDKNELRIALKDRLAEGKITYAAFLKEWKALSEEHHEKKQKLQQLYKDYKVLKLEYRKMLRELKEFYTHVKEPTY